MATTTSYRCAALSPVMKGYWKRPEDTARILSPDGWARATVADIVNGRIYIKGRIKSDRHLDR